MIITIDGPAGSGKSTAAALLAQRLAIAYLDTGAMYRALTWWCLERGVDVADREAVARLAPSAPIEVGMDPAAPTIGVDGIDLTDAVRSTRVTEAVSAVATNLDVRADMRRRQRALIAHAIAERGAVVAEGRDITTVVAPDAAVRILLTASERARLSRRAHQDLGRDDAAAVAATRDRVIARDALDSTVSQFTTAADGVVTIDSSELGFGETVDVVLDVVRRALP